jgi:hypothetical protein
VITSPLPHTGALTSSTLLPALHASLPTLTIHPSTLHIHTFFFRGCPSPVDGTYSPHPINSVSFTPSLLM